MERRRRDDTANDNSGDSSQESPTSEEEDDPTEELVADEGDRGPAQLQNAREPDETFHGTVPRAMEVNNIEAANDALQQFDRTVQHLRGELDDDSQSQQQQDNVELDQEEVMPTGGFVKVSVGSRESLRQVETKQNSH